MKFKSAQHHLNLLPSEAFPGQTKQEGNATLYIEGVTPSGYLQLVEALPSFLQSLDTRSRPAPPAAPLGTPEPPKPLRLAPESPVPAVTLETAPSVSAKLGNWAAVAVVEVDPVTKEETVQVVVPPVNPEPDLSGIPEDFRAEYRTFRAGVEDIRKLTDKKEVIPAVLKLYRYYKPELDKHGAEIKTRCSNDLALAAAHVLGIEAAEAFTLIKSALGKPEKKVKAPEPASPPPVVEESPLPDVPVEEAPELPPSPVEVDTTQAMLRAQVAKILEKRPKKSATDLLLTLIEASKQENGTFTTQGVLTLIDNLGADFFVGVGHTLDDIRKRAQNASVLQVLGNNVGARRAG